MGRGGSNPWENTTLRPWPYPNFLDREMTTFANCRFQAEIGEKWLKIE
jgi:hypothetical protein